MDTREYSDEKLIADLCCDDDTIINEAFYYLYEKYYGMAASFIRHNNGSEEEAGDVFQDSLIAFYENIRNKRFRGNSTIKTYLYATIKNTWYNHLKKNKNTVKLKNPEEDLVVNEQDVAYDKDMSELLNDLMEMTGESCRQILKYYYYDKLNMKEIKEKMDFISEKSAKSKKYKCMQKLIELINSKPGLKELLLELL